MRLRAHLLVIFLPTTLPLCANSQSPQAYITQATQRVRDADRQMILESELQTERERLSKAQASFDADPSKTNADDVHRHEENVKALERELSGVRPRGSPAPVRLVVKATRPTAQRGVQATSPANYWNPYSRSLDITDFSTNQRSETP